MFFFAILTLFSTCSLYCRPRYKYFWPSSYCQPSLDAGSRFCMGWGHRERDSGVIYFEPGLSGVGESSASGYGGPAPSPRRFLIIFEKMVGEITLHWCHQLSEVRFVATFPNAFQKWMMDRRKNGTKIIQIISQSHTDYIQQSCPRRPSLAFVQFERTCVRSPEVMGFSLSQTLNMAELSNFEHLFWSGSVSFAHTSNSSFYQQCQSESLFWRIVFSQYD